MRAEFTATKQRLEDLLTALEARAWRLATPEEDPLRKVNPFVLEFGELRWGLVRGAAEPMLILKFRAFTHMGFTTDSLTDIFKCTDLRSGRCLYFSKRRTSTWRRQVAAFAPLAGQS